jgi:hypothetical protein
MFKILENATLSLSKILNRRAYVVLAAVFFALVLMLSPTHAAVSGFCQQYHSN